MLSHSAGLAIKKGPVGGSTALEGHLLQEQDKMRSWACSAWRSDVITISKDEGLP